MSTDISGDTPERRALRRQRHAEEDARREGDTLVPRRHDFNHGCCADAACNEATCMELPASKTCGDCVHIYRCRTIFGHTETDTYCDWFPRRFLEVRAEPRQGDSHVHG